ncbi:MAG TPA: hypothetical protein ENI92_06475 [Bacteroidetes bacterium]|nr:hypothetical protein [Bacteroidota bacterium]
MENAKMWREFDRTQRALDSIGLFVVLVGVLSGIILIVVAPLLIKLAGVCIVAGSLLVGLYHYSFSLLMKAIRTMCSAMDLPPGDSTEGGSAGEPAAATGA